MLLINNFKKFSLEMGFNLYLRIRNFGIKILRMESGFYGHHSLIINDVGRLKEHMIYRWFRIGLEKDVRQVIQSKWESVIKNYSNLGY